MTMESNKQNEFAEMEALDRIRGKCVLPQSFSEEGRRVVVRVLHDVLGGLRDIAALHPIEQELDDADIPSLPLIVQGLGVRSSIIYLSPNQRELIRKDNPLRQQLLDIQHHDGEEGRKAKDYLKEIERLNRIISKSISVMHLGVIRGVTVKESLDKAEALNCEILYQIPLPNLLNRSLHYHEATDLAANDVRKYLYQKGISLDVVRFREVSFDSWKLSDVEERYRPIAKLAVN